MDLENAVLCRLLISFPPRMTHLLHIFYISFIHPNFTPKISSFIKQLSPFISPCSFILNLFNVVENSTMTIRRCASGTRPRKRPITDPQLCRCCRRRRCYHCHFRPRRRCCHCRFHRRRVHYI